MSLFFIETDSCRILPIGLQTKFATKAFGIIQLTFMLLYLLLVVPTYSTLLKKSMDCKTSSSCNLDTPYLIHTISLYAEFPTETFFPVSLAFVFF